MNLDTLAFRTQAARQRQARKLLRRAAGRLEVARDGRVLVRDPALARQPLALRAELRELLEGHRCLACGEPIDHSRRVPAENGGHMHTRCAGKPPGRG